jgi:predicted ATP-dependent protease
VSKAYVHETLGPAELRWLCDPGRFEFQTTAEVEPTEEVIGQEPALEALRFGLETDAPGQNIFVRGLIGTGRSTMIRRLLASIHPPRTESPDRVYVYNFSQPESPRLLTLPSGTGELFQRRIEGLTAFIREGLAPALSSDLLKSRINEIQKRMASEAEQLTAPFEAELRAAGLAMMTLQLDTVTRPVIVPLIDGEPAPPERLEALRNEGRLSETDLQAIGEQAEVFAERMGAISEEIQQIQRRSAEAIQRLIEGEARGLLDRVVSRIRQEFPAPEVGSFLDQVLEDLLTKRLQHLEQAAQFTQLYLVNVVLGHEKDEPCAIVVENAPSIPSLAGSIDGSMAPEGQTQPPQLLIRAGSLLRADGGFLILEARDVLSDEGAWRVLIRTLRSGHLELVPPDFPLPYRMPMLRPERIPINVKVILLGDPGVYPLLDANDPDFPNLFKVLADFDSVIERDDNGLQSYARVLARICKDESLLPFDRTAVAALCEHGARIAAQRGKLTVRFGRLADLAREAVFLASGLELDRVSGEHVEQAVRRSKRRGDLPSRRYRDLITDGTIRIETRGSAVGQIHGLAVVHSGPLSYGFPSRITATIGPGTAGAINIEREAELSGAIHTKGFYILGGLLRYLLRTPHPLAFDASIAFEQSYGGIDGDSASGAEMCCLLSALTDLPLRQDLAMTGAIDQVGNVLPIGAVNEKIEGFFDVCEAPGLSGTQGVIVPAANAGDLMLRRDVVDACGSGLFSVYAINTIHEALGLFTGIEPGRRNAEGSYPEASVLHRAVQQARQYWEMAVPRRLPDNSA